MKESEMPVVAVRLASPGYFQTARIPMLAGRDFTDARRLRQAAVVIVSENTAKRFWPGPGSARQAHHADDDDEGSRRRSSAWCAR